MPATPGSRSLTVNGIKLAYLDWGKTSAQPLVLLHGLTSAARVWDHLAAGLSDSYRVLALDQRGHGDSEWTAEYTESAYVADLGGFIQQLGLENVIVLGLSMGARIAMLYAAKKPRELDRIICIEGPIWSKAETEGTKAWLASMRDFAVDSRDGVLANMLAGNPRIVKAVIGDYLDHAMKPTADGKLTWKYDRELRGGRAAEVLLDQLAEEPWETWNNVAVPTLLIRGEESDSTPAAAMERLVKARPSTTLVTVENAGHTLHVEQPDELRRIVRDWLSGKPV